jgi:hypothetical protein
MIFKNTLQKTPGALGLTNIEQIITYIITKLYIHKIHLSNLL